MTASRTETILAAVATALAATSGVSGRVWRDRAEAVLRSESPALLIEAVDEDFVGETTCRYDWLLRVRIIILVRDGAVSTQADAIRSSIHSLIMANATINSYATVLRPGRPFCEWSPDKGDGMPGMVALLYEIGHRSLTGNLTAA